MTSFLSSDRPVLRVLPRPKSPLFISTRRAEAGGSIRLILAGELDLAARQHLATDLESAQEHSDRVLLDLSALAFLDCACLATIFIAARRARRESAVLTLVGPRGQVRRLLELTGTPPGVTILDIALFEPRAPVAA